MKFFEVLKRTVGTGSEVRRMLCLFEKEGMNLYNCLCGGYFVKYNVSAKHY